MIASEKSEAIKKSRDIPDQKIGMMMLTTIYSITKRIYLGYAMHVCDLVIILLALAAISYSYITLVAFCLQPILAELVDLLGYEYTKPSTSI